MNSPRGIKELNPGLQDPEVQVWFYFFSFIHVHVRMNDNFRYSTAEFKMYFISYPFYMLTIYHTCSAVCVREMPRIECTW